VKTAVSLPDELFEAAERLAARFGWGRSQLYAYALEAFLARSGEDEVTAGLDEVYGPDRGTTAHHGAAGVHAGPALIADGSWEG
jgi:predicted transcriptional regulator